MRMKNNIDVSNLQVFDLLQNAQTKQTVRITKIDCDEENNPLVEDEKHWYYLQDLLPIRLTSDIMRKNGFICKDDIWVKGYNSDKYGVRITKITNTINKGTKYEPLNVIFACSVNYMQEAMRALGFSVTARNIKV